MAKAKIKTVTKKKVTLTLSEAEAEVLASVAIRAICWDGSDRTAKEAMEDIWEALTKSGVDHTKFDVRPSGAASDPMVALVRA